MMPNQAIESIRERLAYLEHFIGPPMDDENFQIVSQLDQLDMKLGIIRDNLVSRVESLETDLAVLKKGTTESSSQFTMMERSVRVKMSEPKPFSGIRDSKEVENFLWDMEQYFSASHVPDSEMVTLTSMYLTGDAKLWWRSRLDDDTETGKSRISTWESLKKELRDQFLPCNTAWVARDALKRLTHTGTVREYVKRFTSLLLYLKNMSEEDKLFNFLSGLQPWAQLELRRQVVKDLPSAIATVDGLVDYKLSKSSNDPSTPKQNFKGKKGRDMKKDKGKKLMYEGSRKDLDDSKSKSSGFTGCFICNGPHRAKECPKREKLNAVQLEIMTSSETDSVPTRVE